MKNLPDFEVLAALENLRLRKQNSTESPDYILRVATAIVAKSIGYNSRADWTAALQEFGAVEYMTDAIEQAQRADLKYQELMNKLDAEYERDFTAEQKGVRRNEGHV